MPDLKVLVTARTSALSSCGMLARLAPFLLLAACSRVPSTPASLLVGTWEARAPTAAIPGVKFVSSSDSTSGRPLPTELMLYSETFAANGDWSAPRYPAWRGLDVEFDLDSVRADGVAVPRPPSAQPMRSRWTIERETSTEIEVHVPDPDRADTTNAWKFTVAGPDELLPEFFPMGRWMRVKPVP